MKRPATRLLPLLALLAMALLVAGCGGGGGAEATPPAGDGTVPVVPADPTAPVVGDPNAPVDPNAPAGDLGAGDAGEATIPDLQGGEDTGGLPSLLGASIFEPRAQQNAPEEEGDDPLANDDLLGDDKDDAIDLSGDSGSDGGSDTGTDTGTDTDTTTTETIKVNYTGAEIYLDGQVIDVKKSGTFPKGAPIFTLVNITSTDIEIELIAGQFVTSSGKGLVLDRGKLLTLANQTEQMTYRIKYLRPVAASNDEQSGF